jgi:hypothetical protein
MPTPTFLDASTSPQFEESLNLQLYQNNVPQIIYAMAEEQMSTTLKRKADLDDLSDSHQTPASALDREVKPAKRARMSAEGDEKGEASKSYSIALESFSY